jgi:FkbM family methyltransferase
VVIVNAEYYREMAKQCYDLGHRNIYAGMYKNANEIIPESEFNAENFLKRRAAAIAGKYGDGIFDKMPGLFADGKSTDVFNKIIELYRQGSFDFSAIHSGRIYFNDIFKPRDDELFIDCGAYDGKSVVDFIFYTKGKYQKILAYEPDIANFSLCRKNLADLDNVFLFNCGLADSEGDFWFDNRGTQSSKFVDSKSDDSFIKVHTVKLDSLIDEPVSFIKMDIEGAEYSALLGAAELLRKHKPKLAISVYHNDEDLIRIPVLLRELVPEYQLYLRHHTTTYVDTVLYAKV